MQASPPSRDVACGVYVPALAKQNPWERVLQTLFMTLQVREAIHVEPVSVSGGFHICTRRINYKSTISSLLPTYPARMYV